MKITLFDEEYLDRLGKDLAEKLEAEYKKPGTVKRVVLKPELKMNLEIEREEEKR